MELPATEHSETKPSTTNASVSEKTLFDEIPPVYGAAKYDQKVHEAPAAITIITAEQIRKYGYRNFAQILDSVPGLLLAMIAIMGISASEGSIVLATTLHASCC